MMIHWMWAVAALAVGMIMGIFLAALMEAGRDSEEEYDDDPDGEDE